MGRLENSTKTLSLRVKKLFISFGDRWRGISIGTESDIKSLISLAYFFLILTIMFCFVVFVPGFMKKEISRRREMFCPDRYRSCDQLDDGGWLVSTPPIWITVPLTNKRR